MSNRLFQERVVEIMQPDIAFIEIRSIRSSQPAIVTADIKQVLIFWYINWTAVTYNLKNHMLILIMGFLILTDTGMNIVHYADQILQIILLILLLNFVILFHKFISISHPILHRYLIFLWRVIYMRFNHYGNSLFFPLKFCSRFVSFRLLMFLS